MHGDKQVSKLDYHSFVTKFIKLETQPKYLFEKYNYKYIKVKTKFTETIWQFSTGPITN